MRDLLKYASFPLFPLDSEDSDSLALILRTFNQIHSKPAVYPHSPDIGKRGRYVEQFPLPLPLFVFIPRINSMPRSPFPRHASCLLVLKTPLMQAFPDQTIYVLRPGGSIDPFDLAFGLEVFDHGHASVHKGTEALADAFGIVVGASRRLAPVQQPLLHYRLRAVKEEREFRRANAGFKG